MNFNEIVGHKKQINLLKNIFSKKNIPQTFLFTGTNGIGKKSIALNCLKMAICNGPLPCGKCISCRQIEKNTYPDFILLKPDEKDKIAIGEKDNPENETVRWFINKLNSTPYHGRFTAIIDGIDKISESGQNALLKTIEEPPPNAIIILIASSKSAILQTIFSRSFTVRFFPLTKNDIIKIISSEGSTFEKDEIEFASIISGGSIQNARILLEKDNLSIVSNFAKAIKNTVNDNQIFDFNIQDESKKLFPVDLSSIMMNLYAHMLETKIANFDQKSFLKNLYIDEEGQILRLLKIFASLKKSQVYNINKTNALKAMILEMNSEHSDLPFLESINI